MKRKKIPFDADAAFHQAMSLCQSGLLAEAEMLLEQLLQYYPRNPALLTALGTVLLNAGKPEDAVKLLERSLAFEPKQAEALSNLGIALARLDRLPEALSSLDKAITLQPDFAEALNNRGNVLRHLGRWADALPDYDRAIDLLPGYVEAHTNRGSALHDLCRFEEALDSHDRALALEPDQAALHNNRGNALIDLQRAEEALRSLDRALALQPGYADAWNNRGRALQEMKRFDEALASYDKAISLRSGYVEACWNKALLDLLLGDYDEGWRLYEWRWQGPQRGRQRRFDQPLWLGEHSVSGKRILIHAEQGFGDVIQFIRYVPLLEGLGATVIVEAPQALEALMSSMTGGRILVPAGQALPPFDLHCPIMSLPLAFKTTVTDIPSAIPYLRSDAGRSAEWEQRLGVRRALRVGLAWSGSSEHRADHKRSIPLQFLEPLFGLPVEYHSLQKDIRPADAAALPCLPGLRSHREALTDFAETAALIERMDLVIAVDTAIAHLAGALGKPVWVMLPAVPDFRWLLDRADSPWYPTARLFRQPQQGDWPGVVAEVTERLKTLTTGSRR